MAICQITGTIFDQSGVVAPDARLIITPLSVAGILMSSHARVVKAVAGVVSFDEIQNTTVRIEANVIGFGGDDGINVVIPATPTATLEGLASIPVVPTTGLTILDEGVAISGLYGTVNFVGTGVVATQASPGIATITITAGGGAGTVTSVSVVTANGISGSVATSTTTPAITLTVQDAIADGATKGIASFTANDFNSASGVISLDYSNAQKASGSLPGLLSSADWTTFNGKQDALGFTAVPNTRTVNGKALSGNITLGLASSDFANQGTTTTVLHGNAGGNPSFAAVSLTADVTGTLPVGNGGTGITSLGTGVATWLGTPSSANLRATVTDELGTGALLFDGATPTGFVLTNATGLPPTTGISGWPANASGALTNNGSGVLSWAAGGSGATTALDNLAAVAINAPLNTGVGVTFAGASTLAAQITTALAGIPLTLTASAARAGSSVAGAAAGGSVTITAGAAARLTSGNANGGDINLTPGAGIGVGIPGLVSLTQGQLAIPAGTGTLPAIFATASLGNPTGINLTTGSVRFVIANSHRSYVGAFGFVMDSGMAYNWSSGTVDAGTVDTGLFRNGAAATIAITNGTAGQWGSLFAGTRDAGTTTVTNGLTIGHQSTGTPAAGLGSGVLFNINSSTTADRSAGQHAVLWSDATDATRTADHVFYNVLSAAALAETFRIKATGLLVQPTTTTAGGTTGAQTINKPTGSVNFAAGANSLVVTNSLVSATSLVFCAVLTNDTTSQIKNTVAGAGSFTITLVANATSESKVGFWVINP